MQIPQDVYGQARDRKTYRRNVPFIGKCSLVYCRVGIAHQTENTKTTTAIRENNPVQWSVLVAILWNSLNNVGERKLLSSSLDL